MLNYTKGEWKQSPVLVSRDMGEDIKHIYIEGTRGNFNGRTIADIGFWFDMDVKECEANALLISQAPAMYETLWAILRENLAGHEHFSDEQQANRLKISLSTLLRAKAILAKLDGGK